LHSQGFLRTHLVVFLAKPMQLLLLLLAVLSWLSPSQVLE